MIDESEALMTLISSRKAASLNRLSIPKSKGHYDISRSEAPYDADGHGLPSGPTFQSHY